jgi:hypothetical protein
MSSALAGCYFLTQLIPGAGPPAETDTWNLPLINVTQAKAYRSHRYLRPHSTIVQIITPVTEVTRMNTSVGGLFLVVSLLS